jgi:hypothetical protein
MQFLQVRGPLKGRVGLWRVSPRPAGVSRSWGGSRCQPAATGRGMIVSLVP